MIGIANIVDMFHKRSIHFPIGLSFGLIGNLFRSFFEKLFGILYAILVGSLFFCLLIGSSRSYAGSELETLVQDGLQSSINIKTQDIAADQASLATKSSYGSLLPTLTLSTGRTSSTSETMTSGDISRASTDTNSADISGSWTLWDNFSSIRQIRVSRINEQIEGIKKNRESESFVLALIDTYFDYLLHLRRGEVLTQQLEQARWIHKESLALVKAGARTEIEALDTEIQVLNSERDLMELNQNIKTTLRSIQVLMNKDETYKIPHLNLLDFNPYFMKKFPSALKALRGAPPDQILSGTMDFKISKLGLDSTLEKLKQIEFGHWPTTSIKLSHSYNLDNYVQDDPAGGRRAGLNSTTLSLNLTWQVWDWWNTQRSIRSSQMDYQVSSLRFRDEIQNSRAKYETYLENYDITVKSLEASEKAVDKALKQLGYSKEMYRLGRINLLSMQQATSRLFDAQISFAQRKKALYVLAARLLNYQGQTLIP
jgi:outer membrane protein TolC